MSRQQKLLNKDIFISCILPVCNAEAVITQRVTELRLELQKLTRRFEIILVDDGSKDATAAKIQALPQDYHAKLIRFPRSFGKAAALSAGLAQCAGEAVILMDDADLQPPLPLLAAFLQRWSEGYDMVYGVHDHNSKFHQIMAKIAKINISNKTDDFRLLDRKVVNALNQIHERERFMQGLYAWTGFKTLAVSFDVPKYNNKNRRKFPLAKAAPNSITAFSDKPLRLCGYAGFIIATAAFFYALYFALKSALYGIDFGFSGLLAGILFFSGVQLIVIGVLSEYIARIFHEVKRRPHYIIDETCGFAEKDA